MELNFSMFDDFPLELLRATIGYMHQPSHLKVLCLTSKTISAVATEFLYYDLILDIACNESARKHMLNIVKAVSMCNGLRFVKTLKVGPIKGEMVNHFHTLISRLKDHSLLNFQWDIHEPPLNSQLAYLWNHQRNIQSIDLVDIMDTIRTIQPEKNVKFPQKYVHVAMEWPRDQFSLKKFDLSSIKALTVRMDFWGELNSYIFGALAQITNLELHHIHLRHSNLELDWFPYLLRLGFYHCMGTGSVLSSFKHPHVKDLRIKPDWDDSFEGIFEEDFEEQFLFIRRFQGLETLAIDVPDQRHPARFLENLAHSISSVHNNTLRYLTLLDSCAIEDAGNYEPDTIESKDALVDAVIACTHLIQVELPGDWTTKERDFERLVENLASLKVLCLRLHIPLNKFPRYHYEKKLPYGINITQIGEVVIHNSAITLLHRIKHNLSSLKLLIFEIRGYKKRHCFPRGWSPVPHLSNQLAQISEGLVKYHLPEYQLMPPYAPVATWREYCAAKRCCIEEELQQEGIGRDTITD